MGIWIRSQSGSLYEVVCVERGRQDEQAVIGMLNNERTVLLGEYSSVKKANVVIDIITKHIDDQNLIFENNCSDEWLGAICTQRNKVFKMLRMYVSV